MRLGRKLATGIVTEPAVDAAPEARPEQPEPADVTMADVPQELPDELPKPVAVR